MNFRPTHLAVTATDLASAQPGGRVVFLPGSTARAARIAEHFTDRRDHPSERGHTVHVGRLRSDVGPVDVASVSTGMGCPSLGIVVTELVELGLRRFVRVGSAGALRPEVAVGHVVIGSAAVRDEGASNAFAPLEFPAVASWRTTRALVEAAAACLPADATHLGVLHSKDSLHGREFGAGPMAEENRRYWQVLTALGCVAIRDGGLAPVRPRARASERDPRAIR